MLNKLDRIRDFVAPFYLSKDIMHDFSHLERIAYALDTLAKEVDFEFEPLITKAALYFHGIIYSHEAQIISFLKNIKIQEKVLNWILKVAWESQKEAKPSTKEGLILHDAHMLEGGPSFEIIKSLITGSVRGQSLEETMIYIEKHLLSKGQCYTRVGQERYLIMKRRTLEIYQELNEGLGRDTLISTK